ncbi:hypothetical protein DQ04_02461040 [Trypanosoma grayi]|uniref:hypothetical protein n=1 Tax=Trypanosoma grayi TaxID=71804 RepID=UPI0004F3F6D5|nr:hypothetical protein DQ04_02461040 [Trypanosoma grayi]KEG11589.1 hypothetical protein DQ04_02461040 [Trypanosoma grayi]
MRNSSSEVETKRDFSVAFDQTIHATTCDTSGQSAHGFADDPRASLSVPEYLDGAVMAVLTEGLEDLCRQRPANPVDHLAFFLLRRSQSNAAIEVAPQDAVPMEPLKTRP